MLAATSPRVVLLWSLWITRFLRYPQNPSGAAEFGSVALSWLVYGTKQFRWGDSADLGDTMPLVACSPPRVGRCKSLRASVLGGGFALLVSRIGAYLERGGGRRTGPEGNPVARAFLVSRSDIQ
jgi:hypothetical protein